VRGAVLGACLLAWLADPAAAQPTPAEPTLEQILAPRGWVAVQLRENAMSQLEADLVIEGEHRVRAQVSTSFSKSIFDQKTVRSFGLPIEPSNIEITGAKGKQRLGSVQLQSMAFGETVVGPVTVFTADLSELVSLGPGGQAPQAVLGSDFLTKYQAVLEIANSKLHLRVR